MSLFAHLSRLALPKAFLFATSLWLAIGLAGALAEENATIDLPIEIEYSLLRKLVIAQLFDTEDGQYQLLDDPSGCNSIKLKNPRINPQGEALQILAAVDAELGMEFFGKCRGLFAWDGEAGFLGIPILVDEGSAVSFDPQDSWLTLASGSRLSASKLPAGVHQRLKDYFGSYKLDLSPQLDALDNLLPEVLPGHQRQQIQAIADSLQINRLKVTTEALAASIRFLVPPPIVPPAPPSAELSLEELAQWEQRWQMMDQLLVEAIKHFAGTTALRSLRVALLDILLESRYRLRDALAKPVTRDNDAVRSWFLQSWEQLAPTVRQIALEQPGQEQLIWFSLLSATDALRALDKLGPGFGLDISTAGLRRLARLINAGETPLLDYNTEVDPQLQELLDLNHQPLSPAPSPTSSPAPSPANPSALRFGFSLFPHAYASPARERLIGWVPSRGDLPDYLPLVGSLLTETAANTLQTHPIERSYQQMYLRMVWATAWQESCWRQYMVKNGKYVPLRSNTGDVGLMQINERVWRGFFDLHKLRWEIDYNIGAGTRILRDYLVKYALRRGEHHQPGGVQNLPRASYSAYNGGPSQVARYRHPNPAPYHRKVDTAFWDKYQQIAAGSAVGVSRCLGGEFPLSASFQDTQ